VTLVAAELFKLRTTRTSWGLVLGAFALILVIGTAASAAGDFSHESDPARGLLGVAGLAQVFALIFGILAITTEFRHGTITPSLLAVPERPRLLLAKLGAVVLVGLVLGLVCFGVDAAVVLGIFSARGIDSGLTGRDVFGMVAGGTIGAGLYAAFGLGLGAVLRNQVGTVVGALGWTFVLEPLLRVIPTFGDWVSSYGLDGVGDGLSATGGNDHALGQLPAGLLFAAYCVVILVAGIAVVRGRDVSA
jgi:ABC-2 type transport system permease protein